jgi:hypothetical protein
VEVEVNPGWISFGAMRWIRFRAVLTDGRRQMYALDPRPLIEVRDWLAHFDRFWDGKLDALGAFLDGDP